MIEKLILDAVKQYNLFEENTVVTVALSGGADSVALLYGLYSLQDELKITLNAAHLNHLIRGDEALRDEKCVNEFCASLNIPLFCERIDVPQFAKKHNLSLETAARQVRYDFLNRVSDGVIATAHTASDNLETVILNLTRGTAVDGLCGIPIKRDNIVRPIFFATREMVEGYCNKNNLPFVTDSTNLTDDYTRNKIRHKIVPVLKELNPQVEKSVLKTSQCITTVSKMIKVEATKFIKKNLINNTLNLKDFENLNPEIAKKVIVDFVNLQNSAISLEGCHIESIYHICIEGGKTSIPKNCFCENVKGFLKVALQTDIQKTTKYSVKLNQKSYIFTENNKKINSLLLNNSLDCDKIVGKLVIRTRNSGDSIRLLNRGCTKPLTKLYNECAVPVNLRESLPVIADDLGVVWVYGIGVSQRCAISKNTKTAYEIVVEENEML